MATDSSEEESDSDSSSEESESEEESSEDSMTFTLTDSKVLDCSICFQALTIPVYQCDNGHIACSTCHGKISNKCPTCSSQRGYSRCRAIENILESIKVLCWNRKYGCREMLSCNTKKNHEKSCPFVPCSCPIPDCHFEGSTEQLCRHFDNEHKRSSKSFLYNQTVVISLKVSKKFLILREETDGSLYILNNKVLNYKFGRMGNAVSVRRIGPSTERSFMLLEAADESDRRNTLTIKSYINSSPRQVGSRTSSGFLLVPNKFSCTSRKLDLSFFCNRPA